MYKRRFLTTDENAKSMKCVLGHTITNSNFRKATLVDEFYCEKRTCPDGSESVVFLDPIIMLFNQQRLEKVGPAAVQQFIESMMVNKQSPLAELRKNCEDSDLCELVKSRHLQSPSEVAAWAKHIENNMSTFVNEVQRIKAERLAKSQAQQSQSIEPNT